MQIWTMDTQDSSIHAASEIETLRDTIEAIVYARVSTQDQAKYGYSLESQVEKAVSFAKSKFGIDSEHILAVLEEGEMGDNANRPALLHALTLLEQGVGRSLIVLHPDRLARDLRLQLSITDRIWNAGCEIVFVEMDVNPNNPESVLLYNIQGAIAQYNKAKILANSKRGRRTKVRNGQIPGLRRIYGYHFDTEHDTLVPVPEEQATYQLMVDWVLHGLGGREMNLTAIAKELSILAVPAPSGDKWYQATVSRMLKNPAYTGTFYYGKTEYKQHAGRKEILKKPMNEWQMVPVPALIDEATFQQLQEKLSRSVKRHRGALPTTTYLLKGRVRCGRCGAAVVAGSPARNKRTKEPLYYYYVCSQKSRKVFEVGTGHAVHTCLGRNWRKDVIDDYVWKEVCSWIKNERNTFLDIVSSDTKQDKYQIEYKIRRERLLRALEKKEIERKRWLQLSVKGRVTETELEEGLRGVLAGLSELRELLVELDAPLARTQNGNEPHRFTTEEKVLAFEHFLTYDIREEDKMKLVQALVQQVVLHDEKIDVFVPWKHEV
jgi:site-specific DNA recombinase